jgi:hypothetical protein
LERKEVISTKLSLKFNLTFLKYVNTDDYTLKPRPDFFLLQAVSASSRQEAERKFETLLLRLSHPPSMTTVRVNTHLGSVQHVRGLLLEELQKVGASVVCWAATLLFFKDVFIYFMYVSTLSLSSDTPQEGIISHYRWL